MLEKYHEPEYASYRGLDTYIPLDRSVAESSRQLKSYSVEHQYELYGSSEMSRKILAGNKATYERVMGQLQRLEENRYLKVVEQSRSQKHKLRLCRSHIRILGTSPF